jgi:gas vesicle protein
MAKGTSRMIIATIAGFAAGVAVGILFAPDKGSKTRKKLNENFFEFAADLEKFLSENFEELKSAFNEEKVENPDEKKQ